MPVLKYKKKPLIIEAIQYTGDNEDEILEWSAIPDDELENFFELIKSQVGTDIGSMETIEEKEATREWIIPAFFGLKLRYDIGLRWKEYNEL